MSIAGSTYVRKRLKPDYGDDIYIINRDLLHAIKSILPVKAGKVLDYGAGGSPYESLFCGKYDKADIEKYQGVSIEIDKKGRLPAGVTDYDVVLSSQVLEHVSDPKVYLDECFRVLRPGGKLVLSTHGVYEDHPCPDDLWRWTSAGLENLIHSVGFQITKSLKTTCGVRAVLFLWSQQTHRVPLKFPKNGSLKMVIIFASLKLLRFFVGTALNKFADLWLSREAVKESSDPSARLYINIVVLAEKPFEA